MNRAAAMELPPQQRQTLRRARRLEWLTIAYLISAVTLMALVLGSSQAMKTAWIEDLLSLIPPIAFLIAARYASRAPNDRASPTAFTGWSPSAISAPRSPCSSWGLTFS